MPGRCVRAWTDVDTRRSFHVQMSKRAPRPGRVALRPSLQDSRRGVRKLFSRTIVHEENVAPDPAAAARLGGNAAGVRRSLGARRRDRRRRAGAGGASRRARSTPRCWSRTRSGVTSPSPLPAGDRTLRRRSATCSPRTPTARKRSRRSSARPMRTRARFRSAPAKRAWAGSPSSRAPAAERRACGPVRLTAAQIAIELSRDAGGGRGRRRGFWDRLLARAYEDPLEAREDAQARGIALAPGYVAVAVEGEGLDEASRRRRTPRSGASAWTRWARRTGEVVVVERGGGFFFLVPAPLEIDASNARTAATLIPRGITRAGIDVKIVGGIGRHAEMLARRAVRRRGARSDDDRAPHVRRRQGHAVRRPRHLSAAASRRRDARGVERVRRPRARTAARTTKNIKPNWCARCGSSST